MVLLHLSWLIPLGVLLGVSINHLANILPLTRKLSVRPLCPKCGQTFDIPNYIPLKPCPNCNFGPGLRQKIVFILALILTPVVYYFPPLYVTPLVAILIFAYLALVLIIDLEHRLVLHPVSLVGGILFLITGWITNGWLTTLLGLAGGFGLMYLLYLLGILFGKYMSKRRGEEIEEIALGFGDVTLSAILGLLLGWPRVGVMLFLAILFGGIFSGLFLGISMLSKKYRAFTAIPYAPFIIVSCIFMIYFYGSGA